MAAYYLFCMKNNKKHTIYDVVLRSCAVLGGPADMIHETKFVGPTYCKSNYKYKYKYKYI